ncbi:glycine-rich domain-containing protein [Streptomyces sp. NPDC086091]|uniref:glycine-rich domain-containing protein n=1 Tax=Streptomyces sp. NPDC086091 TaxID=3365751 RepID=UPI00380520FE
MTIAQHATSDILRLISPALRADLITMVREDHWPEITDDQGIRGVEQLAAFLAVAATTSARVTPSLRVDLFWHAFVLHTRAYADFCDALGGGFIHHVPDRGGVPDPGAGREAMRRTAGLLRTAGHRIDPEFWPLDGAADCTQSYAGCSDSPVST